MGLAAVRARRFSSISRRQHMKSALSVALAIAFAAASAASLAQTSKQDPSDPLRAGQSPRCDSMTGDAREQCLRDENTKTENKPAESDSASSGSSSAPS